MTDTKSSKETILYEWDICAGKMKTAKTVEDLCNALGFMLMALRPLIERETVTDDECQNRMKACPAHALIVAGAARPALVALVNQFPWLAVLGIVGYVIYLVNKSMGG